MDEDTRLVLYCLVNGLGRMVVGVIVTFWLVSLVLEIFIFYLVRFVLSVNGSLDEGKKFFMTSFCIYQNTNLTFFSVY